jgi:hypothetical protein
MVVPVTDRPVAGFYATRLVRGGIEVPVRIWFGAPIVDGDELDRSPRWCVELDGKTTKTERDPDTGYEARVPLDPLHDGVWPFCARKPITESEFAFLTRRAAWAREHQPEHPAATPRERVDVRRLPPVF